MSRRAVLAALAALLLIGLAWFVWTSREPVYPVVATVEIRKDPNGPASRSKIENRKSKIAPPSAAPEEVSHMADDLNSPKGNIRDDLRILENVLENFRTNFPHDGNPVGDNAEITAVLTGRNRLHYAVVPPNHPAINRAGELCDRWGTPFFFHAESGTRMTIRSAGPDKKMWTEDDVELSP